MPEIYEIPVQADVFHYQYRIRIDGELYILSFRYNKRMTRWILDIMDSSENMLLAGIPLVLGVDLLRQHRDNRLPQGNLFLINIESQYEEATRDDLGTKAILLYREAS